MNSLNSNLSYKEVAAALFALLLFISFDGDKKQIKEVF